jgi:hypothetical protein
MLAPRRQPCAVLQAWDAQGYLSLGYVSIAVDSGKTTARPLVAGDRYMAKPTIVEALFSYRRAA